jgi:DNA polymerase-3 subunit epsilon
MDDESVPRGHGPEPVGRHLPGHWTCGTLLGFDLETTGIDVFDDLPVSFALVTFHDRRAIRTETSLVDCGRESHPGAEATHGITRRRAMEEGVMLDLAAERMAEIICSAGAEGIPLVGMNVSFDLTMLDTVIRRSTGRGLAARGWSGPVVDCLVLDKHVDKFRKGRRQLGDLCDHYGVTHRGAHDAVSDVVASVEVAIILCQQYDELRELDPIALTTRQTAWKHEQTDDFSRYRERNGQTPIPLHEHRWPVMPDPTSSV